MQVLNKLEQHLQHVFIERQHALIRQHSVYYWQTVWLQHLQAFADWALEYRVQQLIGCCPIICFSRYLLCEPRYRDWPITNITCSAAFYDHCGQGSRCPTSKAFYRP